ncbi:MAG: hypothetical protein NWE89_12010 [Candidatus Bathyarchaeota archaeon]|nr:hypothetical protein [Candidatus Bathyarchaeota archaeon]
MEKPVNVTVFPRPNSGSCGSGCNTSCASCSSCGISCGFYEAEQELMDDLYFLLKEIGSYIGKRFLIELIDTADVNYAIERLNVVLATNSEQQVNHQTYGNYLTVSGPLVAVNNHIVSVGDIPEKNVLTELVKEAL